METLDPHRRTTEQQHVLPEDVSQIMSDMFIGAKRAFEGTFQFVKGASVLQDYQTFLKEASVIVIGLYILVGAVLLIGLPIVLIFPGLLTNALTLVPLWAMVILKARHPMTMDKLFYDALELQKPGLGAKMASKEQHNVDASTNWWKSIWLQARTSLHFAKLTTMTSALSIVPILGPILAFFGQYYLVAERLSWNLFSTFMEGKDMDYSQQRGWMRANKWKLLGFALPFCVLLSVPVVGPFGLGIAQAAAANLFAKEFSKKRE